MALAPAIPGSADVIATEDKDALDLAEYEGIRFVTGAEPPRVLQENE